MDSATILTGRRGLALGEVTAALAFASRRIPKGDDMKHRLRTVVTRSLLPLAVVAGLALPASATPVLVDVEVGATPSRAETRKTVRITQKNSVKGRKVVMRADRSRGDLPDFADGDKLVASAEVQVTTDCEVAGRGCVGKPYGFAPHVGARLLLTRDPDAVEEDGAKAVELQAAKSIQCNHTEHHCLFVFRGVSRTIGTGAEQLHNPCASSPKCFVSVVVNAWHGNADPNGAHKLLIGENEPNGTVDGGKGSVSVVRISPAQAAAIDKKLRQRHPIRTSYPITDSKDGDRYVVLRKKIGKPQRGREYSYRITARVKPTTNRPVRISTEVFVTGGKNAEKPVGKGIYPNNGRVSQFNGQNCLKGGPCTVNHVGVFRAKKSFKNTLWLVVLFKSKAPFDDLGNGRHDVKLASGRVTITRYVSNGS